MHSYSAPVRDMRFLFEEVLDGEQLQQYEEFADLDADTLEVILEEAGKFCAAELLPINVIGDEQGAKLKDGQVVPPKGFKEAYQAYCDAGWNSIAMAQEYGGQGLPKTVHMLIDEILSSTNMAFGLYPGLTNGAYTALDAEASDEVKQTYFPKMAEGTWSGTMCLTEPQCGTDLGMIKTRAEPQDDDSYLITGTKIFITCGEHDLTENMVQLVLARTPDAPAGIKGISLFLVPKFMVNDDGSLGERNSFECVSTETKMGIRGAPACVMSFENAKGYLIGELNRGMRPMFKMMNTERVAVGIQGLGISEGAYQRAVAYAKDRIQGRSLTGAKRPEKAADPITVHPDVRRMLLSIRAKTEGCRALAVWMGLHLDIIAHETDPQKRQDAEDLIALLTPVTKAYLTDVGFDSAVWAQQVFGGHGYIYDYGIEQLVRDARIGQIYEGTNGVQAMDLVGRKLPADDGRAVKAFLAMLGAYIAEHKDIETMQEFIEPLAASVERLQKATAWMAEHGPKNADHIGAAAYPYMNLMALVTLALLWSKMAAAAMSSQRDVDPVFYQTKLKTARFFMQQILPQSESLMMTVMAGADSLMDFAEEEL